MVKFLSAHGGHLPMLSVHISPLQFVSWIPVHDVVLYLIQLFDELGCSGRIGSSYYTYDTRRVTLITNPVISYEWGKDWIVITTNGTYPWSFVTLILRNGWPSRGGDRKTHEVVTSSELQWRYRKCDHPELFFIGQVK